METLGNYNKSEQERILKIKEQIEYYFSDFNLKSDIFMRDILENITPDGVNLSVLLTFKRLRILSKLNVPMVITAIDLSNSIEFNPKTNKVYRKSPLKSIKECDSEMTPVSVILNVNSKLIDEANDPLRANKSCRRIEYWFIFFRKELGIPVHSVRIFKEPSRHPGRTIISRNGKDRNLKNITGEIMVCFPTSKDRYSLLQLYHNDNPKLKALIDSIEIKESYDNRKEREREYKIRKSLVINRDTKLLLFEDLPEKLHYLNPDDIIKKYKKVLPYSVEPNIEYPIVIKKSYNETDKDPTKMYIYIKKYSDYIIFSNSKYKSFIEILCKENNIKHSDMANIKMKILDMKNHKFEIKEYMVRKIKNNPLTVNYLKKKYKRSLSCPPIYKKRQYPDKKRQYSKYRKNNFRGKKSYRGNPRYRGNYRGYYNNQRNYRKKEYNNPRNYRDTQRGPRPRPRPRSRHRSRSLDSPRNRPYYPHDYLKKRRR